MKTHILLALISFITFNAFCITQEEKDKIYDAIITEAKCPEISKNMQDLEEEIAFALSPISATIDKDKKEAYKAAAYLSSLPPSAFIPAYYELKTEGKFRSDCNVEYYASIESWDTEKYDESSYLYILNGKPIVKKKRHITNNVGRYLRCEAYLDGPFIKRVAKASYVGDLKAYWWLEGRRFMAEIWNDWYPCWKHELSRKEPRSIIIKELIDDISYFGTFLFPYLYEAIKEGDDSLASVLKAVKIKTDVALPSVNEFCEWYEENHFKYDYPPCEGIRKTIERVTDPYILSELKGEGTYDDKEKYGDKWAFSELDRKMFKQILWETEDYYKNRDFPPDYWYYSIPDEAVVKSISDFYKALSVDKINKRLLNKLKSKSE